MSYTETKTYNKDIKDCFTRSKMVLEKAGCKILRQREFIWLIQASKNEENREYLINVTWRLNPHAEVTVSCVGSSEDLSKEKRIVGEILSIMGDLIEGD